MTLYETFKAEERKQRREKAMLDIWVNLLRERERREREEILAHSRPLAEAVAEHGIGLWTNMPPLP